MKGTVDVVLIDLPTINWHVRFTKAPFITIISELRISKKETEMKIINFKIKKRIFFFTNVERITLCTEMDRFQFF